MGLASCFDVEIPGNAVHEQVARELREAKRKGGRTGRRDEMVLSLRNDW